MIGQKLSSMNDRWGKRSSKRLCAVIGLFIGYVLAVITVVYGLDHTIASPSVVNTVLGMIVGSPFATLIATIFEKRKKDDT